MALQGNFIHYTYETHPTETETITVTYPSEGSPEDPDYEKRGTTETQVIPKKIEIENLFSDVYVFISAASVQFVGYNPHLSKNNVNLHYIYKVYNSVEDKNLDDTSFVFEGSNNMDWDYTTFSNPTEAAYTHLRAQKGSEGLSNLL